MVIPGISPIRRPTEVPPLGTPGIGSKDLSRTCRFLIACLSQTNFYNINRNLFLAFWSQNDGIYQFSVLQIVHEQCHHVLHIQEGKPLICWSETKILWHTSITKGTADQVGGSSSDSWHRRGKTAKVRLVPSVLQTSGQEGNISLELRLICIYHCPQN